MTVSCLTGQYYSLHRPTHALISSSQLVCRGVYVNKVGNNSWRWEPCVTRRVSWQSVVGLVYVVVTQRAGLSITFYVLNAFYFKACLDAIHFVAE